MRLSHWDRRFLGLAEYIAGWSKDPSTKVGCVITDSRHRIISVGFNGLPAGVKDKPERLNDREQKLLMVQHAEVNALNFASRDTSGCIAYTWPLPPCTQCAGALIQAGIERVVAPELTGTHDRWERHIELTKKMFAEAGVQVDLLPRPSSPREEGPGQPIIHGCGAGSNCGKRCG